MIGPPLRLNQQHASHPTLSQNSLNYTQEEGMFFFMRRESPHQAHKAYTHTHIFSSSKSRELLTHLCSIKPIAIQALMETFLAREQNYYQSIIKLSNPLFAIRKSAPTHSHQVLKNPNFKTLKGDITLQPCLASNLAPHLGLAQQLAL